MSVFRAYFGRDLRPLVMDMQQRPDHYSEEQHVVLRRHMAGEQCDAQALAGLVYQYARSSESANKARQVAKEETEEEDDEDEEGEDEEEEAEGDDEEGELPDPNSLLDKIKKDPDLAPEEDKKPGKKAEPVAFEDQDDKDDEIILA